MVARACPVLAFVIASLLPSCSSEFETSRVATARSLGQELYTLVCDRVGAQALREDVTGRSFRSVCHPNGQGAFAERVDVSLLPPIDGEARDTDGHDVSLAKRLEQRRLRIARIEALARRRRDLIAAFDSMIPDVALDVPSSDLPTTTPGDSSGKTTSAPAAAYRLRSELTAALSRIVDLYNDGSVPELTRALAEVLGTVEQSQPLQDALARLDSRQGYRPPAVALGVLRPALAYPRLPELANALLRLVATDSDPFNPKGKLDPTKATLDGNRRPIAGAASGQFQAFLATLHEELRVLESAAPPVALRASADPVLPNVIHLSRPRSSLEMAKELLLDEASAYGDGPSRLIVGRDPRSVAQVRLVQGLVPAPFVDADGDGLPDLDALDRFKPLAGYSIPTPFVAGSSGTSNEPLPTPRDGLGRAVGGSGPVYDYLDTNRTFLASILRDSRRLFDAEGKPGSSTVMGLVGAIPVLSGPRDEVPIAVKVYPSAPNDGALAVAPKASRAEKAPASDTVAAVDPQIGSQRKLTYRAFHPENSPLSNLIHALGQIAANPAVDDTMALTRALVEKQPQTVARLVGLALDIKRILDGHPEATLPGKSTFVDEVLEILVKMARVPGVMEDLLRALTTDDVLKLSATLEAFLDHKDVLSYNRDPNDPANAEKLNGPLLNKTRGLVVDAAKPFGTKVDRSRPDTGENRSAFQRMAQLLHDANGLAACNKAGAVAHVKIRWKGIPVDLDYPSNPLAKTVCAFVGGGAPPDPMPQCGILRFENIDELLLDVALGRAKFAIQDRCLDKIVKNETLTGLVGGANAFLEEISGIRGFSLDPTVGGVARLAFFETPYAPFPNSPAFAGDGFYPKSRDFLRDIIDPIPSTVCPLTPFVDRDGKVLNLRSCTHFKDTLRGRDGDALFPLDTMGFIQSIRPFAAAFADHGVPLLFVELFDAVHLHWGSSFQSKDECDPTLPRSHARWCSQDGLSRSEAMLVDVLRSDLFATAQSFAKTLAATSIAHCDDASAVTGECTKTHPVDGIHVVSEMLRVLLDPARTPGLKARDGRTFALRNDGTPTQGLSAAYLFFDALKGIDKAFESWAMAHPGDTDRQANLKAARSQVVDTYLSIKGTGTSAAFENPAIVRALPKILDTLRAQLSSHCPRDPKPPESPCVWAAETLPKEVEEWMSGPSYAAAVDLLDAVRKDETARRELERLALYLIDDTAVGGQPSRLTTSLAAAADSLLFLNGASNLTPIYRMMSTAALPIERDAGGRILQRGFVASSVDLLARLYARCVDETGKTRPDMEVDPHRAFGEVLKRMVMPIESRADRQSPAEILVSILSDVNRADPSKTDAFQGADFGNIAKELNEFLLDPAQGLEQVYEVIREATKNL